MLQVIVGIGVNGMLSSRQLIFAGEEVEGCVFWWCCESWEDGLVVSKSTSMSEFGDSHLGRLDIFACDELIGEWCIQLIFACLRGF